MDLSTAVWSHHTELPAQPTSASQARAFVRQHLGEHDTSHLVDDVELIASELATNALGHAQTPFTVTLAAFPESLLLEVSDGSPSTPRRVAAAPLDPTGRGLTIVALLSRDWGVTRQNDGHKSVWAAFDNQAHPAPAGAVDPTRNEA